jgi:hypothetical protein
MSVVSEGVEGLMDKFQAVIAIPALRKGLIFFDLVQLQDRPLIEVRWLRNLEVNISLWLGIMYCLQHFFDAGIVV